MTCQDWIQLNVNFMLQLRIDEVLTKLEVTWRCAVQVFILLKIWFRHRKNLTEGSSLIHCFPQQFMAGLSFTALFCLVRFLLASAEFWLKYVKYTSHKADFTEGELTFFFFS